MKIIDADGRTIDFDIDTDPPDLHLSAEEQMRGILKALRVILRCYEGESILRRAATVMRRADRLAEKYPEFGPI